MRSRSRQLAALFCSFLTLSTLLFAQSATTSVRGVVTDSKGAVVVGATVTIIDPATGLSRAMNTGGQGEYQFLELPPATYELNVKAQGFATVIEKGVLLLVRTPGTLNVTLEVSAIMQTVEVNAAATLINTEDASLGHAFAQQQIESLPFEGREPASILTLQAGVTYTGNSRAINSTTANGFDKDSRSGSVNGGRSDQTNITLDGTDNNDQSSGRALQGAMRVPLDSLEEFRVTTANADADSGRSSGGQIALVTKSGTNSLHGGAYEYYRPTFAANDWFNKAAQISNGLHNRPAFLLRNTFGAFVGGPIKKDRAFFFLSYEGMRKREDQIVTQTVPSANLRKGTVSYTYCNDPQCTSTSVQALTADVLGKLDPNCSSIGSCNFSGRPAPSDPTLCPNFPSCPGSNPYAMQVFQQYPSPNSSAVGDGLNLLGYTFASPWPDSLNMFVGKLDYNLTADGRHRLFLRGVLDGDHNDAGAQQFPGQPNSVVEVITSKGLTAGYTAALKNSWINNFRFGYIRQAYDDRGLQNSHFVHFRFMTDINAFTSSEARHVPALNFVDDVSKQKGNHTLQFGVNLRKVDNTSASNFTSFFTATTNQDWLANSGIANTGVSLDPANTQGVAMGLPAVAGSFGHNYDVAVTDLAGLISEVNANYNLDKHLNSLPEGTIIHRDYRDWEWELYAQDSWRMKPNLTVTFGLRYSLLEPPYETSGTQVAPGTSVHDWFINRSRAAYQGLGYFDQSGADSSGNPIYDHTLQFDLSGKGNGKRPYWGWDYRNFAPRLAIAYSPSGDSGIWKSLWGGAGKSSIRLGWGMYYDHFGQGISSTFDRQGAFGLATAVGDAAGSQTVDCSVRFTGLYNVPSSSYGTAAQCPIPGGSPLYTAAPSGSFPVTPPYNPGYFTFGLDDKLKTPYSHVFDLSITRDLGHGYVLETSYVGRFGHRLLQEIDLAQPANLRDPGSGMTYYQAATALAKQYRAGVDVANVAPIAFWEHFYPMASSANGGALAGCATNAGNITTFTATQAIYDIFDCRGMSNGNTSVAGNETSSLAYIDFPGYYGVTPPNGQPCFPACATINGQTTPFAFFSPQYASLDAWSSIGNSAYNSGQLSLRHHSGGLSFDINYTYSKSFDVGSNAERISVFEGLGFSSQVINAWAPKQLRAPSDFDATHMVNANWVYELPVGKGKRFGGGMSKIAGALLGGWQVSGLWRWSTGFPFDVYAFNNWATNWDLESYGVLTGPKPKTGQFIVAQAGGGTGPNVFKNPGVANPSDPNAAVNQFRYSFPGESGQRNELRGPGTFNIDMGLSKAWKFTESQNLKFSWEVFNVTNSARFDVGSMMNNNNFLDSPTSFGNFINTLSQQRVMQLGARYTF